MKRPIVNIIQYVDALYEYLTNAFKDYSGLAYKDTNDPNSGSNTSKPIIYKYLCPSADCVDDYPANCPALCISLDERLNASTYRIAITTCVRYDAIANREMIEKVQDSDNKYQYIDEDGYDTKSDIELYTSSLLISDFIYNLLSMNSELNISNINMSLPDASLPDFPYSISTITFETSLNLGRIAQNPYNDLY